MVENEITRWFVAGEANHRGPFTQSEICAQLDAGVVMPETFVWKEGMPDWLPAIEALPKEISREFGNDGITDGTDWAFLFKDAAHAPAAVEEAATPKRKNSGSRRYMLAWLAALTVIGAALAWRMTSKSNLPVIRDVNKAEALELNSAIQESLRLKGAVAAIALSLVDPSSPRFYIATNHQDGTQLDITLQGVSDTLVGHFQMSTGVTVTVNQGMALTPPFHQTDGRPLAKGDYIVSVSDGEKILEQKTYFLGGVKDQLYEQNLKGYHAGLVSQAEAEINELKQLIEMISHQAKELNSRFQELAARQGSHRKEWERFLKAWQAMQKQVSTPFAKWNDSSFDHELFYGDMYRVLKTVLGRVEAIQQTQTRYLDLGNVDRGLAAEISNEISVLQADLDGLRARVQAAEAMPTTANGMPQWPVSNVSRSDF